MTMSDQVRAQIDAAVKGHKVVLFMKGTSNFPQCGFSATVVSILNQLVPRYETVNVLTDPGVREGIKEYSQWPTIPQLYVDGEFVGGCDIVKALHASGELTRLLGVPAAEAPARVKPLSPAELKAMLAGGEKVELFDVRTTGERALATL